MDPAEDVQDVWRDTHIHDAVSRVTNVLAVGDQQPEEHEYYHSALRFEGIAKATAQTWRLTDLKVKSVANPDRVKLQEIPERFVKSQHCFIQDIRKEYFKSPVSGAQMKVSIVLYRGLAECYEIADRRNIRRAESFSLMPSTRPA